ncbi:MAG TPA: hypothetical protein VIG90_16780 [Pedomonas sp.]|uniref:hypothetical protein n=1 Tax=Pedomonas sp. TaxID=2976421 RepID=UPI002F3EA6E9
MTLKRSLSPNGDYSAVVFRRDCGATTGFSTQISILGPDETPDEGGNVFVADDNHGTATLLLMSGPWADAQWLGPRHLLVRYAPGARIFRKEERVEGVTVTFKAAF